MNDMAPDTETPTAKKKSKGRETTETIVIALGLALITRAAVAEPRYIPSESMLPTLKVQDRLIVEKISNYTQRYQRGDILVFYPPSESRESGSVVSNTLKWLGFSTAPAYIKRVVGLPGESLEVKEGKVWINGKVLSENYIKEPPVYDLPATKIPENHFFMMGDNRNNSMDSHVWGPLPIKNVIGHAAFRFWPLQRIGTLD
ncbi:MAG: signal peptidase I [Candidatus Sericytochromatia bacterium]|nr:signal peptidase I [Candidatus Sericytochromatia bacterium]